MVRCLLIFSCLFTLPRLASEGILTLRKLKAKMFGIEFRIFEMVSCLFTFSY